MSSLRILSAPLGFTTNLVIDWDKNAFGARGDGYVVKLEVQTSRDADLVQHYQRKNFAMSKLPEALRYAAKLAAQVRRASVNPPSTREFEALWEAYIQKLQRLDELKAQGRHGFQLRMPKKSIRLAAEKLRSWCAANGVESPV